MSRARVGCRRLLLAASVAAFVAIPAAGQEREGVAELLLTRPGLQTPEELKRIHEDRARREWVFGQNLIGADSYDSNIFESPDGDEGAPFVSTGFELHIRRYLTPSDRFRARAIVTATPFLGTDRKAIQTQRMESEWRRQLSARDSLYIPLRFRHENDHVVNTEGESPLRDFAFTSYELEPAFRREFGRRHWILVSVLGERRYYPAVAGLDDFDYWRVGPLVRYQRALAEDVYLSARYAFRIEDYDAETAYSIDGTQQIGNPTQKYHDHLIGFELRWDARRDLRLFPGYSFSRRDDRFVGFKSYDDHEVYVEAVHAIAPSWTLSARTAGHIRDFDKRPARIGPDRGGTLHYQGIEAMLSARYRASRNLALFGSYRVRDRNSNRDVGAAYRSYVIHQVTVGVTVHR